MRQPFRLYTRCEKDGASARCPRWPDCDCDLYDRPTLPDGKRPWRHLPETARNRQLAYRLANKLRQDDVQVAVGLKKAPKKPLPLLGAYAAAYLARPEITKQKELAKTTKNLDAFIEFVSADTPLDLVTKDQIEAWHAELLKRPSKKTGGTYSRNTAQRVYNSVKGLFSYAAEGDDKLEDFVNPCAKIVDLSEDPAERRLWHPDELWLIEELPPLFRLPLKIGQLCGCRRAEALGISRHDLSPKGFFFPGSSPKLGWIKLQRKKKRVGMVKVRIPILLSLVDELRAELKSPFQHHVFGDPPPSPNSWSSLLTREMRYLGERYEVDTTGLCMHGTRHTATTTMQDVPGVGGTTTRDMGGWTSTRMVETYSHPADASLQAAAMGLARAYRPRKPKGVKAVKPAKQRRAPRRKVTVAS